jgi:hypothetical protein
MSNGTRAKRRTGAGDLLERPAFHFRDQRARPALGRGVAAPGQADRRAVDPGTLREDLALDAAAAIEKRAGMLVRQLWDRMGWAAAGICQPPRSA